MRVLIFASENIKPVLISLIRYFVIVYLFSVIICNVCIQYNTFFDLCGIIWNYLYYVIALIILH